MYHSIQSFCSSTILDLKYEYGLPPTWGEEPTIKAIQNYTLKLQKEV